MKSLRELAKKVPGSKTTYSWIRLVLKEGKKIIKSSNVDLNRPNIRTKVKIGKLRTISNQQYKQEYIDHGFGHSSVPVEKTPHFQFILDYQTNPKLNIKDTSYWKIVDLVLTLHKKKIGGNYIHNKRVIIKSATERCASVIKLYEKIKSKGKFDPIEVMATHDGKYVITDGLHRAAISYALGRYDVPIVIKSVDKELLELVEILKNAYPKAGRKALYTPIDSPFFNDWKVSRDNTRWKLIRNEVKWKDKKILDIGSYTGYFSHKIATLGGNVTGIDIDDKRLHQSKIINTLLGSNVKFLNANLFDYLKDNKFDCILLFSVLHWILKEEGINGVRKMLDLISSRSHVMFFDMGQDNEAKMRTQEWNHGITINRKTIPHFILSNSRFEYFKHLGTGDTGRDVFKFSKDKNI